MDNYLIFNSIWLICFLYLADRQQDKGDPKWRRTKMTGIILVGVMPLIGYFLHFWWRAVPESMSNGFVDLMKFLADSGLIFIMALILVGYSLYRLRKELRR